MPEVLRASGRSGVLIIPKSARLLNLADVLPVPRGTPRVSPPLCAQFLCWRKTLGEYPVHMTRYCFAYLPTTGEGWPKAMRQKTPVCYRGQNLD